MDFHFCRSIIVHPELKKAFGVLFEVLGKTFSDEDLHWFINFTVSCDNEYAFKKLIEYRASLMKEVNYYPYTSKKILSELFNAGLLIPGTDEGFNAFISLLSYGKPDKDIISSIAHPSYSRRTDEDGVTPLMYAVKNEDFPVELYKLLITSPSDVNIQDEYGQTALHYMAKTDYPECIEDLLELGADPFITDNKGNNVLHILAENKERLSIDIIADCISLLPEKLLIMENNKGITPITLFFQKLTGTEKEPYRKLTFPQFLEQYLVTPESLNGNILIGGSVSEMRLKTLELVRDHVIRQIVEREIKFEFIAANPEAIVPILEKLADEENENSTSYLHLFIIDELYDCQSPEFGRRFEYAINRLNKNADVLIIAATKFSSADIITDIIQHAFPYRITSKQSSDLNSKIFIGEDYAAYIGQEDVIIKGFDDDLLLSNLKSDGKENEETDEDSIVLTEAERILDKHLSAFKELAK